MGGVPAGAHSLVMTMNNTYQSMPSAVTAIAVTDTERAEDQRCIGGDA